MELIAIEKIVASLQYSYLTGIEPENIQKSHAKGWRKQPCS
jgi:hypothetical protein